jgi:hypothetical protein
VEEVKVLLEDLGGKSGHDESSLAVLMFLARHSNAGFSRAIVTNAVGVPWSIPGETFVWLNGDGLVTTRLEADLPFYSSTLDQSTGAVVAELVEDGLHSGGRDIWAS